MEKKISNKKICKDEVTVSMLRWDETIGQPHCPVKKSLFERAEQSASRQIG